MEPETEEGKEKSKEEGEKTSSPAEGKKEGDEEPKEVTEKEKSDPKDKDQTDAPKDVIEISESASASSAEIKTDSVATPSCDKTTPVSDAERLRNAEKTFGMLYAEKILGLLSAILPRELTVSIRELSVDKN